MDTVRLSICGVISNNDYERIDADSLLSKLRLCESLHLDLLCVSDHYGVMDKSKWDYNVREISSVRHFNELALRGNLRNLKSLMVPCDQFQFLYSNDLVYVQ